jgi:hypothetical protein
MFYLEASKSAANWFWFIQKFVSLAASLAA